MGTSLLKVQSNLLDFGFDTLTLDRYALIGWLQESDQHNFQADILVQLYPNPLILPTPPHTRTQKKKKHQFNHFLCYLYSQYLCTSEKQVCAPLLVL